jgi:hypothetical protein
MNVRKNPYCRNSIMFIDIWFNLYNVKVKITRRTNISSHEYTLNYHSKNFRNLRRMIKKMVNKRQGSVVENKGGFTFFTPREIT